MKSPSFGRSIRVWKTCFKFVVTTMLTTFIFPNFECSLVFLSDFFSGYNMLVIKKKPLKSTALAHLYSRHWYVSASSAAHYSSALPHSDDVTFAPKTSRITGEAHLPGHPAHFCTWIHLRSTSALVRLEQEGRGDTWRNLLWREGDTQAYVASRLHPTCCLLLLHPAFPCGIRMTVTVVTAVTCREISRALRQV